MLTLYFSPGGCSLASHIAIEETGAPYEAKLTALAKGSSAPQSTSRLIPAHAFPRLRLRTV